ncbi:MAG: transcription elongation factor subunit Spt4 [archaeon]
MKKKVCKECKVFYEGDSCPICKKNSTAVSWNGRINVINAENSIIAKRVSLTQNGEYAIKVR